MKKSLLFLILAYFTLVNSTFSRAAELTIKADLDQKEYVCKEIARKQALLDEEAVLAGVGRGGRKVSHWKAGFNILAMATAFTSVSFFVGSVGLTSVSHLLIHGGLANAPVLAGVSQSLLTKSYGLWQIVMGIQGVYFVRDMVDSLTGKSEQPFEAGRYIYLEQ